MPSHKDNKMSIDGIESANPYPLYQSSVEEGSWSQFAIAFVVILIFGILGVIGACVLHSRMRKKGWIMKVRTEVNKEGRYHRQACRDGSYDKVI